MVDLKRAFEEQPKTILRNAIRSREMTQMKLAEKMRIGQSSISGCMGRQRMSLDPFVSILDALDFDVIVVDRETGEEIWKVEVNAE